MAGRAIAFILTVTFLCLSAIVPEPNECWDDHIYAFSGPPWRCDLAKKRCENETVLLKNATEECGQYRDRLHSFMTDRERNRTMSRQVAYVTFRDDIRRKLFSARFAAIPNTVTTLLESGYNCKKYSHLLSSANPEEIWSEAFKHSEMCAFFPELKKQSEDLVFETFRNTSLGLAPTKKAFWKGANSTERYCEWLVERLTDYEWAQDEVSHSLTHTLIICALIVTGSAFVSAVAGFILGKRRPQWNLPHITYHAFNIPDMFKGNQSELVWAQKKRHDLEHQNNKVHYPAQELLEV
uniref:Uncharacterized protein n=1 Tax=Steinernema glaseri TaxID=37863 RepID=A0A1I7Z350_9BILA